MKKLLILTLAPLLSLTLSAREAAPSGGNLTALQQADRQFLAAIDGNAVREAPVGPAPTASPIAPATTAVPAFRQTVPEPKERVRPDTVREQPSKKSNSRVTRSARVEKQREYSAPPVPRAIPVIRISPPAEFRPFFRVFGKQRLSFSASPWVTVKTTTVTTRSHRDDDDDDDED